MIWNAMNINMTVAVGGQGRAVPRRTAGPYPACTLKTLCGTRSSEKAGERETGRRKPGVGADRIRALDAAVHHALFRLADRGYRHRPVQHRPSGGAQRRKHVRRGVDFSIETNKQLLRFCRRPDWQLLAPGKGSDLPVHCLQGSGGYAELRQTGHQRAVRHR